jgi:Protein of unknown function (DUF3667)
MTTQEQSVPDQAPPGEEKPTAAPPPVVKVVCANCGAELLGEYCYSCGQPVKGMIRPLSSMMHDIADTIFNIDSRIFRTLWPLLTRPGYLSNEYFSGRRVRFVTPFRLYFFLSIAAFFAMQLWIGDLTIPSGDLDDSNRTSVTTAATKEEVSTRLDAKIVEFEKRKNKAKTPEKAERVQRDEDKLREKADERIKYLDAVADAKAKGIAPPPNVPSNDDDDDDGHFQIMGKEWDAKTNPVRFDWLPAFANDRINIAIGHIKDNISHIGNDWKRLAVGALSVLPQVLFVVMPLFALLLKIFFIFKRRLYMEHLIIALHSHAFIFFALLLITLLLALRAWAETAAEWLTLPLGWLIFILGWWIPIYLFLMQKKVYKQGWIMTTLKYGVVGICYTIIIVLGVVTAVLVSPATT